MSKLRLSIVTENYDRIQALKTGAVEVPGCRLDYTNMKPAATFSHVFRQHDFDIIEMSFSSYMMNLAKGGFPYRAIPVFLSRVFPHGSIYIRTDRGIAAPQDLKGRLVGIPNYHFTRGLTVKGMLEDEYGVKPSDIGWRTGPVDRAGEAEYSEPVAPPGIDIRSIAQGATLGEELLAGRLDAIISYRAPQLFTDGQPLVGRLFADFRPVEQDWFRRKGIFPVMHVVGLREDLIARHPALPADLCRAFEAAKAACLPSLSDLDALAVTLPWLVAETEATIRLMGPDYWPYGVARNQATIEAQTRWSFAQGLSGRRLSAAELFAPGTLDWTAAAAP